MYFKTTALAAFAALGAIALTGALAGCATATPSASAAPAEQHDENFEADRAAILAMAGNYKVKFDFIETVSFDEDYELKDQKISGGHEIVRVIADEGDFISLQHILVVGGDEKFPVKHWRQDWRYEPESVLVFKGGNTWKNRPVSAAERQGKWSQTVYQVDDAPRYGALGTWSHDEGVSEWTPPSEWRPLPRRDATTRDDYHAVDAVNRHTITPAGWVHEQDNTKLVLTGGAPRALVREIGVNTYTKFDDFEIAIEMGEEMSARFGENLSDSDFAAAAFHLILCREPNKAELGECVSFLEEDPDRSRLVLALLNHNDFVMIR